LLIAGLSNAGLIAAESFRPFPRIAAQNTSPEIRQTPAVNSGSREPARIVQFLNTLTITYSFETLCPGYIISREDRRRWFLRREGSVKLPLTGENGVIEAETTKNPPFYFAFSR
jgi:hypothetical protein